MAGWRLVHRRRGHGHPHVARLRTAAGSGSAPDPQTSLSHLRYAIGNVLRPGGHTAGILVAIGLSVMVIVTVSLVERALLRQVGETRPVDAPTFFFIDLQPDQTAGFAKLDRRANGRDAGRR